MGVRLKPQTARAETARVRYNGGQPWKIDSRVALVVARPLADAPHRLLLAETATSPACREAAAGPDVRDATGENSVLGLLTEQVQDSWSLTSMGDHHGNHS